MGIFSKKFEENLEKSIFEKPSMVEEIFIPKGSVYEEIYKNSLIGSFFEIILKVGDMDDFRVLTEKSAELFFEKNKSLFMSMKSYSISIDSLKNMVITLNQFLDYHKLGAVKIAIKEKESSFYIIHYNSPFALMLKEKSKQNVCFFFSEFYSKTFSLIFDRPIKIMEDNCAAYNKEDYCIFKPSNI
ncbi:hypothetical protein JCM14244_05830 [Venenivibrio stagnispumantis]|uniref:Uncharacterized protein n=1 Tax=Venenivibrio stagnispumantis TaxID=407998 RepID=A0AA45WI94_9AQUI|nr:hypothetical protein [Venenivibrio stagnispumantis]MCW4572754.1 hypothetical protein [Venenivibrio stagnispumantis]SMP00297.1 hypothetical protein SAMN06264868_10142 [Venenivibrio stagnispumantis]